MSTQLTITELKEFISSYINPAKIAGTHTPTRANTIGLLDKIAKVVHIEGDYNDKLAVFNGEEFPLAKDIEEYFANLVMPTIYDPTGASALAPADLTYMKPSYSQSLGRRKIKVTKRYDDIERAFTNEGEYSTAMTLISKRLQDSKSLFDYVAKKNLLATYGAKAVEEMTSTTEFSNRGSYEVGVVLYRNSGPNDNVRGVVVKKIVNDPETPIFTDWADAVEKGYIVELDLVTSIAEPTDTASGEAFIKCVKTYVKKSQFVSEGNSLNGNTLGASTEGLVLVIKAGVMPSLEVDTLAGAFHADKLGFGVEVVEVDDFGNDDNNIIAMLVDRRGVKMHPSYIAVREGENADGDFINYVMHFENTAFYSRNTFLHVFKKV